MPHIDEVQSIIDEITSYTLIQSTVNATYAGVYIQPSPIWNSESYTEIEFLDIVVIESTLALLQTKKKALLRCKTTLDFDYNEYGARGTINVLDGTQFAIADALAGDTSLATGTVYNIDGNTLYLKYITGTWQNGEVITDGATHSSTTSSLITELTYPFFLDTSFLRYDYTIDYNTSVGGQFACWIRLEARWTL